MFSISKGDSDSEESIRDLGSTAWASVEVGGCDEAAKDNEDW